MLSTGPGGLYLFVGADRPRKLQRIHEFERALSIQPLDRHELDGATARISEVLTLCRQQPAMSLRRLVVIDHAHRLDAAEQILDASALISQTACVILLVESELGVRHPLQITDKRLTIERFPARETPAVKPFAMTEALGARDLGAALSAVQDQLASGKEPLELLGLVAWQVQRWVMVKRLAQAGSSAEGIAAAANMRPWQVQRLQAETASRSLEALQQLLTRCWQLDTDAKRGRTTPLLAIEQLVSEVCVA